jgi:hypothetical protein
MAGSGHLTGSKSIEGSKFSLIRVGIYIDIRMLIGVILMAWKFLMLFTSL